MEYNYNKVRKTKKMMLWFGLASICMTFAGLTSAYIVSESRSDWVSSLRIPSAFMWSTLVIIISSLLFYIARLNIRKNNLSSVKTFMWIILLSSVLFVYLQFLGFSEIIKEGYYFTGPESTVSASFLYVLVMLHLAHIVAGVIACSVILSNTYRGKYSQSNYLGFELGEIFWHFLGFLWLYLYLFLIIFH